MSEAAASGAGAPAASATPSAAPAAAPASSGASAAPAASGSPAGESAASITPDTFGWDAWDGKSYDPFPEEVRPWASKLGERHAAALGELRGANEKLTARLADLDNWFGSIQEAGDGADESAYEAQLADLTKKLSDLGGERDSLRSTYEKQIADLKAEHASQLSVYEKQQVQSFLTANKAVLDLPGADTAFVSALEADLDPGVAIAVIKAGHATGNLEGAMQSALEMHKRGYPGEAIMQILPGAPPAKPPAPKPSTAAAHTQGGEGATPPEAEPDPKPPNSYGAMSEVFQNRLVQRGRALRS